MKSNRAGFRTAVIGTAIAACGAFWLHAQPAGSGWVSLFNGTSLDGWNGRGDIWKVENGAITGETLGGPTSVTDSTYIFWTGGEPADFELTAEVRTEGEHVDSGIVYRGYVVSTGRGGGGRGASGASAQAGGGRGASGRDAVAGLVGASGGAGRGRPPSNTPYLLAGPQLDIDGANRYTGQYYEIASPFGLLVHRGQFLETDGSQAPVVTSRFSDDKTLSAFVKPADWNRYRVIAHGSTLINIVNDHVMSVVVDDDPKARSKGLLAFQIEGLGKVYIRNVSLKTN